MGSARAWRQSTISQANRRVTSTRRGGPFSASRDVEVTSTRDWRGLQPRLVTVPAESDPEELPKEPPSGYINHLGKVVIEPRFAPRREFPRRISGRVPYREWSLGLHRFIWNFRY